MPEIRDLASLCRGRNVYIQTHDFPDPDAIASAFGLQRLLARYGVEAQICYQGRIDKLSTSRMLDLFQIRMLSPEETAVRLRDGDAIVCVDSQKSGGNITDLPGDEIAAIDHHPTYTDVEYLWSDLQITGACATLIAEHYQRSGSPPDRDAATALLYGIKIDTLRFTRGVTERDIQAFAYLFPLIDRDALSGLEKNDIEFQDLKAYGAAIESIRLYGYVGLSWIPFPCPDALIAVLSDLILSLYEVEVAVVCCDREDGIKISVRSERPDVHAGDLTHRALERIGSGGGHAEMAGGLVPADRTAELGRYPADALRDRFLSALEAVRDDGAGRGDHADSADGAGRGDHADSADGAGRADHADSAGRADHADHADSADGGVPKP